MYKRLLGVLERATGVRVAVLGDFMLDRYLYGDAERISPEAPVPVLRVVRRETGLGGAASVAADIAALSGRALCLGVTGADDAGRDLRQRLESLGASTDGLVTMSTRPTTVKTRLVGLAQHRHRQQLLRIDEEDAAPIEADAERRVLAALDAALSQCAILCIQDYGKGVATPTVCQEAIRRAAARNVRVLVDPMRSRETARYAGAWLSTPNRAETEIIAGVALPDIGAVKAAAARIRTACRTEHVCVTLDAEGCALIGPDGGCEHLPTRARDVYDVTGAGDAVLAALAVGLAAGADLHDAAALANLAGGIEVEKFGCVPVTRDEIIGEIMLEHRAQTGKVRRLDELLPELTRRRAMGDTVVFTNGCFDLLHRGHIEYLARCRAEGDAVVVGMNSDASVRRQDKGGDRPVVAEADRAAVLAALESVDYVVIFDEETPLRLIEAIQPDVLVKGEDWASRGVVGREVVELRGGRVVLAALSPGHSTSRLLERIRRGV